MDSTPTSDTENPSDESVGERPIRQLLHAATGDRDAEAAALSDQADVSTDDARAAVRRTHGDVNEDGVPTERDVATAADAKRAEESE